MFLILPGSAPSLLWLWQVSLSPNKLGQFSVLYYSQSLELSSVFHYASAPGTQLRILYHPHQADMNYALHQWQLVLLAREWRKYNLPTSYAGLWFF
jgi:hypothetical protein